MFKHILIATDGSELARKGLDQGLALAAVHKSKITVLSVSRPLHPDAIQTAYMSGVDNPAGHYDMQREKLMQERFSNIQKRAEEHGVSVDLIHEIDESPADAIVRQAKLSGCDLIVMSSHGRRGIQKMLLGSQTSEVLVKTTVPVLVIR